MDDPALAFAREVSKAADSSLRMASETVESVSSALRWAQGQVWPLHDIVITNIYIYIPIYIYIYMAGDSSLGWRARRSRASRPRCAGRRDRYTNSRESISLGVVLYTGLNPGQQGVFNHKKWLNEPQSEESPPSRGHPHPDVLLLPIVYGVLHRHGTSEGERILHSSRAVLLH